MKISGIITEYSPFHNGHIYHINTTKRLSESDLLVCAMSGNFTMRGGISAIEKYTKAEIALKYGVDLVVEIPFPYVNNYSDIFAYGAVSLLNQLQVTDIYFGSETADLAALEGLAKASSSKAYQESVKKHLETGLSYGKSSILALNGNLKSNDILGISYIKAIKELKAAINLHPIKRIANNYLDQVPNHNFYASATTLRLLDDISPYVPKEVLEYQKKFGFLSLKDFFNLLYYKIGLTNGVSLEKYLHVSEGIENLLKKSLDKDFDFFIKKTTTKRYSANRITRILISILTDYYKDTFSPEIVPYINILAFNEKGQKHLHECKKNKALTFLPQQKNFFHPFLELSRKADFVYYSAKTAPKPKR